MTADPPGAVPGGLFAERLLAVIDEGQRTATYKLALVLALIDATAEAVDGDGRAPDVVGTRPVAEQVVRLYLPQVRRFPGADGRDTELRQITARQKASVTLDAVRLLHGTTGAATADRARAADPSAFARTVSAVERNFVRYPIELLQRLGADQRPFLYTIEPSPDRASIRLLRFLPGAGDELLRLAPLVRPLIELHWARMVADLNGGNLLEDRLRAHLFGADRTTFPEPLRNGLAELQDRCCFYCGDRVRGRGEVDHFVPWSRWPNDAIENLVLADRCNGAKSNHLAAFEHVGRWATRLEHHGAELREAAAAAGWASEPGRSLGLARSTYAHVPAGTPLWLLGESFVDAEPAALADRLASVTPG